MDVLGVRIQAFAHELPDRTVHCFCLACVAVKGERVVAGFDEHRL